MVPAISLYRLTESSANPPTATPPCDPRPLTWLQTGRLAYDTLNGGTVPVTGSTGAVLGRVLVGLSALVGSILANVRVAANQHRRGRVTIPSFLDDIATGSRLLAEHRGQHVAVDPIDPELAVDADPQLLASAVTNLLNNACKFTRPGGRIRLAAHRHDIRLRIEVEECGGPARAAGHAV